MRRLVHQGTHSSQWANKMALKARQLEMAWTEPSIRRQVEPMLDFRYPHEWFPLARTKGPRTIYCHVGPTNSGKTHVALKRLQQASRGVYCAPLRLLAVEMWERLNTNGKPCALRTGEITQGTVEDPSRDHRTIGTLSCTVEMLDLSREFDVAVIDEIQMVADDQRGWAFTQALLGVPAKEIYVCGEEATVPLIRQLAEELGDHVEVIHHQRLSPLLTSTRSCQGKVQALREGDCVVAFSRRQIFQTKFRIERQTDRRCAVVYGSLPMENRTMQAKAFNSSTHPEGCSILVASDAIGMGLNLNIRRIVFMCLEKYNGRQVEQVSPSQIKQIAGRAGRFGTANASGEVTTFYERDMTYLRDSMSTPNPSYRVAGLQPLGSIISEIAARVPNLPLVALLSAISTIGKYGPHFSPCITVDQRNTAYLLENFPSLSLSDRFLLSTAPVKSTDTRLANAFSWFVSQLAQGKQCPIKLVFGQHGTPMALLEIAESFYRALDLYLWLSNHFPTVFTERQEALEKRAQCNLLISKLLTNMTTTPSAMIKLKVAEQIALLGEGPSEQAISDGLLFGGKMSDSTETPSAPLIAEPEIDLKTIDSVLLALDSRLEDWPQNSIK